MLKPMGPPTSTPGRSSKSVSKKASRDSLLIPALVRNQSGPSRDLIAAIQAVQEEDEGGEVVPLPPRPTANSKFTPRSRSLVGISGSFVGETPTFRPRNYISQLIIEMEEALLNLNATNLTLPKLEAMAVLIYESMSISTRNYHSVQHVFDLISQGLENNHIAILAACFHDCIYYHVDGGLTTMQAKLLEGIYKSAIPTMEEKYGINGESDRKHQPQTRYQFFATTPAATSAHKQTRLLPLVETIFGYTPGQEITISRDGLNEFLSAVIAVRQLQDHLSTEILAEIACCIQATIPFRPADPETGKTHMEQLYENMLVARDKFALELSDDQVVASVQRACLLSNSDVGNFGTTDLHWFLDNTWSLLPETNESLRDEYVYSVQQFHRALQKMNGFFGFLQPEVVFHEFRGVPCVSEMQRLTGECRNNLQYGKTYVGAKLLAMSLVAALATLSGGDEAPISLFTGDLKPDERRARSIFENNDDTTTKEDSTALSTNFMMHSLELPQPSEESLAKCTRLVYDILAVGRRTETSFDIKRSPWAAYLYASMGDEEMFRILKEHTLYPMTEDGAWALLRDLPREAVENIAEDMCDNALSRAEMIRDIVAEI
ncbi:hypothetical protein IV203_008641 [Nitzschia inconspicua]|uniref:Uncharacterized protein n=1 Tax=Nitzschia inconspicua TaxID=303405 RepID=A0A9K3L0G7_9STRA|nr:hypothetical protein IV203_008641 [Nitzschia inconspicua]